jgi:hypothetical protein
MNKLYHLRFGQEKYRHFLLEDNVEISQYRQLMESTRFFHHSPQGFDFEYFKQQTMKGVLLQLFNACGTICDYFIAEAWEENLPAGNEVMGRPPVTLKYVVIQGYALPSGKYQELSEDNHLLKIMGWSTPT